jgi:hypothetical protein
MKSVSEDKNSKMLFGSLETTVMKPGWHMFLFVFQTRRSIGQYKSSPTPLVFPFPVIRPRHYSSGDDGSQMSRGLSIINL